MTGLTTVELEYCCRRYIPVLTQYCHNLTTIKVSDERISVSDIMSICRTNPMLKTLSSKFHLRYCADRAHTLMSTPTYTMSINIDCNN